jgi:hypothetical protein
MSAEDSGARSEQPVHRAAAPGGGAAAADRPSPQQSAAGKPQGETGGTAGPARGSSKQAGYQAWAGKALWGPGVELPQLSEADAEAGPDF